MHVFEDELMPVANGYEYYEYWYKMTDEEALAILKKRYCMALYHRSSNRSMNPKGRERYKEMTSMV